MRTPRFTLYYTGKNITAEISRMFVSLDYTDHKDGTMDELELKLEDRDQKWQGPWFPVRGDLVNATIGYQSEGMLPCGDFQVDEITLDLPPDTVTMRCVSAYVTAAMRTANSAGFENQTLTQIATTIAAKHGLQLVDVPNPLNLAFERISQRQESDLAFLRRLANRHNYDFNVRGGKLQFFSRGNLEAQAPVFALIRGGVAAPIATGADGARGIVVGKASFKTKTHQIYKACRVSYFNPDTKQLIWQSVAANPPVPNGDTYVIQERCDNGQQALQMAHSSLHEHNRFLTTASFTIPGNPKAVSGNTFEVSGFGQFDGKYIVDSSHHRMARSSGYSTEIEAYNVNVPG